MSEVLAALSDYVAMIERASAETHRAEDRVQYNGHLAAAARMYRCAYAGDRDGLLSLIESERRSFGWQYLSGSEGNSAEAAFARLAQVVQGIA